jgi:hypothetical protein
MKLRMNIFRLLFIALFIIASLSTSCSNLFGPSITGLTTSTGLNADLKPQEASAVFYIDSPQVCCSASLVRAHKNTAVTAKWIFVNGDMAREDKPLIYENTAYRDTDGNVGFTLLPSSSGFIRGDYRVDILVDGVVKASSTFYIQKDLSGALPQIRTFTLSSTAITSGQPASLRWQVSGASRINIEPAIGKVDSDGTVDITPAADTTYTLYAINRSGASSSTVSIKVMPVITGRADLEIIEFWNTGNVLFYRIRNNGNLASCPCFSALFKNNLQESRDYVAPLAPGEERVESFASYHFSPRFGSMGGSVLEEGISDAVNIRICLNQPPACDELSVENNCFEHNFGPLLTINLLKYANSANWENSKGPVTWPMGRDTSNGWAIMGIAHTQSGSFPGALLISSGTDSTGWMQATMGIPHGSPAILQPFTIPFKSKLTGKIGITNDAPEAARVKFMIGIKQGGTVNFFDPVIVNSKSKLENYEVDLSKLAGKQVELVVRVESGGTLQQGSAAWIDPVLTQVN